MGTARPHLSEHCPGQPAASLEDQISSPLRPAHEAAPHCNALAYPPRAAPLHPVLQHLG